MMLQRLKQSDAIQGLAMTNRPTQSLLLAVVVGIAIMSSIAASSAFAQGRQLSSPEEWEWVDSKTVEGCVHGSLKSSSMKREIGYNVYLPPAYMTEPKERFPVVYYLHGAGGTEASAISFTWAVRQAIKDKAIEDVIYVFPNGGRYSGYRDWDDGSVMAETWIIKELIPHIDKTYRTIESRGGRALCGWSMGGGGSLRFVTKYPDMFCAAATMAASLGRRNKPDSPNIAAAHLEENIEAIRGKTGFWLVVGEADSLQKGNKEFVKKLVELNVDHTFQTVPEVGHNLGELNKRFHRDIVVMLADYYEAAR